MLKQIIWLFLFTANSLFSAEFQKNFKPNDIRRVICQDYKQLMGNEYDQILLYNYAQRSLRRLEAISYLLKQNMDCETVSSLKNNDLESFIASVCDKCSRKNYDCLGRMHDMARARGSAKNLSQMKNMMRLVKKFSQNLGFIQLKIIKPRRPIKLNNLTLDETTETTDYYGYPRFHVVFKDENGFRVEWQFETIWTGKLCETPGDIFPVGFPTPKNYKNDLHDVAYRLFFKFVEDAKNDETLLEVLKHVHMGEFLRSHDLIIAVAHLTSHVYLEEDFKKDLIFLHAWAGVIISDLITFFGPDYLLKQME